MNPLDECLVQPRVRHNPAYDTWAEVIAAALFGVAVGGVIGYQIFQILGVSL